MKGTRTFEGYPAETLSFSSKGDGNHQVLKIKHHGAWSVVKCYGYKRGLISSALKQFGVRLITGKSSYTVSGRLQTERDTLALWRREGFDVPAIRPSPFPGKSSRPCLHLEWIPWRSLAEILRSKNNSLDFKRKAMGNFAAVSGVRHARALQLGEPRLLFEHPSMHHVLASGPRLIHLDFEIVFTKKNDLERLIRHEIAGFLYSMSKADWKNFPALLDAFVSAYPDHARLEILQEELRRFGTVPLVSIMKPFPAFFKIFKRYRRISRYAQTSAMPLTQQG